MPTQTSSLTHGGYFAEDPVNKTFTKPAHADSHDPGDVRCAETKSFTIDEVNALNRRIADTWTPEMGEETERMSRQDRLTRCAKLTEEKVMRAQQRAQLTRDLKKAVAVELRDDALGVDAELRQYEEIRDLLETGVSKSVIVEMLGNHGMSISDSMDEEFLAPKRKVGASRWGARRLLGRLLTPRRTSRVGCSARPREPCKDQCGAAT